MGTFKISKIYINNFKLFNAFPQPINLSHIDLLILDGPNGFGKTSIFDVIELVLTNQIRRIGKADSRVRFKDILFRNDSSKDCVIKVEFENSEDNIKFTIAKIIKANKLTNKNSPRDFSVFDTHILENFDEEMNESNIVEDTEELQLVLQKKLQNVDIQNIFNLVYYVEQEDNKFFLKMSEMQRLSTISQLFNTDKESAELDRFLKSRDNLKKHVDSLEQQIHNYKLRIGELKKINVGEYTASGEQSKIEYKPLLKHMGNLEEWDKKNPIMNENSIKERYLYELEELRKFIVFYDEFKIQKENLKVELFVKNKVLMRDVIILDGLLERYDEINKNYNQQVKVYKELKEINKDTFQDKWDSIDFARIHHLLDDFKLDILDIDKLNTITERLKELEQLKQNTNSVSETLRNLMTLRERIIQKFDQVTHEDDIIDDSDCPLCGSPWEDRADILAAFKKQKESLEGCLDESSKIIKEAIDSLYDNYVRKIIEETIAFFESGDKRIISSKFFNQYLSSYERNSSEAEQYSKWLLSHNINVSSIVNRTLTELNEEQLARYESDIESKVKEIFIKVNEEVIQKVETFEMMFQRIFKSEEVLVKEINEDDIKNKMQYISLIFYTKNFEEVTRTEMKLQGIEDKYKKICLVYKQVNDIVNIYRRKIPEYWKEIMKETEIVFYIYTGKILQSHQRGLGLFMKESEAKIIRFITHPDYDHDIVNFMSSGQLVAVILSFTLALNKVYGNQGLSMLLIDDPLQTMDDLNISSFVELLRNDFKDKQIILSTHEEHAVRYINYKFDNYKLKVKSLNMKDGIL
ncbi:AAA family ATPase [Bacillus wiedmannii]|uniref:AAA family ATPase n=1 Tax=Bacillus wiedmannii TaxID=1890302 RepID=UPI001CBAAF16|nr:AAA family ATPase [Bacillus wiedmannii]MBZ4222595.1 AAA family ATPase [Bacillus wiedmannii]